MQKGFLALVGMRSVSQVRLRTMQSIFQKQFSNVFIISQNLKAKESLGALGWALTSAEVDALDLAADKVPKKLIQNPNQGQ